MKLTIGILVSNRIDTIRKCMDSVKPLLEKGIAELICVDTVGEAESDGSIDIVKEYTDKIWFFKWCGDFAAARNITLEHATGDWYTFLDDDEWFEDCSEILSFFENNDYKDYNSASYIIRNYKKKDGSEWADTRAVRFVKRTPELRFNGKVHETFSELKLPCKEFGCYAHHYGYAFENEEEKRRHRDRNLSLLEAEIKDRPDDLRLRTQMALELASFDNEKALEFVRNVLAEFVNSSSTAYYQWLISLQFPLYEALGKGFDEADKLYKSEKLISSSYCELAVSYSVTRIGLLEGRNSEVINYINKYFEMYDYLKNNQEARQKQNTADFERYLGDNIRSEMTEWRKKCMPENKINLKIEGAGLTIENGVLKFGEKKLEITGTPEEKLAQLDKMCFDDFCTVINRLTEAAESCFEDPFLLQAVEYFENKNQIEYCYLLFKMSETEIKKAIEGGANGAAISELLQECILTERRMYEMLYKPQVFTEKGLKWVPQDVTYNDIMYRFIQGGGKDLKMVLEAAKVRPEMAKVLKVWLGALA